MRHIIVTAGLLVSFCVCVCTAANVTVSGGEKILFVGNSLTAQGGGLDNAVRSALAAGSITVTTNSNITPSTELLDIFNQGNATAEITNGRYDIVVLQGWVNAEDYPAGARSLLFEAVRKFNDVITSTGAKTVLYMTFPGIFQAQNSSVQTYSTIANVIAANYDTASQRIGGVPVAPCGLVYRTMVVAPPAGYTNGLLYADEIHPSQYGQLLSGYVFYETLTGRSPIGLRQTFYSGADPKIDSVLQFRAHSITSYWMNQHNSANVIRSTYKTEYSILTNARTAPSYFLLDGSKFYPGARMPNDAISRMYISRYGKTAVMSYSMK